MDYRQNVDYRGNIDYSGNIDYRRNVDPLFLRIRDVCGLEVENKIRLFIDEIILEKSYNTAVSYLFDLWIGLRFFKFESFIEIESMKVQDFRNLCRARREEGISIASQQRMVISWKVFLRWVGIDALENFRIPKTPKRYPRPVMDEIVEQILQLEGSWQVLRNKALWLTMYGSGMRISEALNLKCEDVDDKAVLIKGKGEMSRFIPLLPKVRDVIKKYLAERPSDSEWLFISSEKKRLSQQNAAQIFRRWADKRGLDERITLHSMRHGFATHLLKRGCPLPGIQKLLGHSQVSTTAQYIEIEDQQLKERINLVRNPSFLRNSSGV